MIKLVEGKKHLIIKRRGHAEEYKPEKMEKVVFWGVSNGLKQFYEDLNKKEWIIEENIDTINMITQEILEDVQIRIFDKIHISKLFDEVIDTVSNKITELTPYFDNIAKFLYVQKLYKEIWGIKRNEYPDYKEVLKKGVQYKVYNREIVESFSEEEIEILNNTIIQSRDFYFTFGGLNLFMQKYPFKYTKNKILELPQHAMMRVAIQKHWKDKNRIENIIEKYRQISEHEIAIPSPDYLNSMSPVYNPTSCVLIQPDDDSESIMEAARSMAIYSKNASGLGVDITRIRAVGSSIGVDGVSSGVVPFIKVFEQVVSGWNQKCYSDDTEILTENGWKLFKDLDNEKVAQYNEDGTIEFVNYKNYYEYELENETMYNFYTDSGVIDHLVSKHHRMVKLIKPSNKIKIEYAKDCEYLSDNHMIVSGEIKNKNKRLSTWDRFLIAFQADGMQDKRITGKLKGKYVYKFSFQKERKIKRMKKLLDKLISEKYPIEYTLKINKNGENFKTIFYVRIPVDFTKPLSKTFKEWVDIKTISKQEIDDFFDELSHWDGSLNKSGDSFNYQTVEYSNIEIIQALAALSNRRIKLNLVKKQKEHWQQLYFISISNKNTYRSTNKKKKETSKTGIKKQEVKYTGKIYCVEVPSGMLIVKRNDTIIISGNSARVGACAVYYPWWHYEAPEIMMLKDAGGTDEERARKLKYAIKWNKIFSLFVLMDEEVYLFDPKEVPGLIESHGKEFIEMYDFYKEKADKGSIRKRKIKARELAFMYIKSYSETGNNYWMNLDEANRRNMSSGFINQSNLCTEVFLATKPLRMKNAKIVTNFEGTSFDEKRIYDGEIGICNLVSVNLVAWDKKDEEEKEKFAYNLLLGMDNNVDYSDYPVKAGERFNRLHRSLGVSPTNYHTWLASKGIKVTDDEALKATHEIMESMSYHLTKASIKLAQERGKYFYYEGSKWEKGEFIHESAKLPDYLNFDLKYDWEELRKDLVRFGTRFEFLMATVPGQTSSLVLNFSEGAEFIREFKTIKEGTYNIPFLAPKLAKYRKYYERVWDIPMERILELAAIRQKFIDQSQSTNVYIQNPDSATEILRLILLAEKLGLKSLYYLNTKKKDSQEECESCSV